MVELLSPKEVAERLKLSRRTVIVWLQQGRLPGIKVGNRWRVRADDLTLILGQGPDQPVPLVSPAPGLAAPAKERPARKARRSACRTTPIPGAPETAAGPHQQALAFEPAPAPERRAAPAPTAPAREPAPPPGSSPEPDPAGPIPPAGVNDPLLNVLGCISAPPIPPGDINKLVYGKEERR